MKHARTFSEITEIVRRIGETINEFADDVDAQARFPTEAFDAMKAEKLLSVFVPVRLGGDGVSMTQLCKICEQLGHYDGSVAMIFAMHQIQVACITQNAVDDKYFEKYLRELCDKQLLLASATTEAGVGGDVRSSICAINIEGDRFTLMKTAPVISYALDSDAIMVTCRRSEDAPPGDQSVVLVKSEDHNLKQIAGWDTLGFRGTCSSGFILTSEGPAEQVMPVPYAQVLSRSMHPVSHLTWASLWTGLAASAVETARKKVRAEARKQPNVPPIAALRLSEVNELLYSMKAGLDVVIAEYEKLLDGGDTAAFEDYGFSIRVNNTKIRCSEMMVDIVTRAMQVVGISAYKNNGAGSLARHLRDAHGAALMVNNDRIRQHNATMQIAHKGR
jgi:acyl-CoA dehydrogenase